jgi:hypothetical protein
VRKLVLRTITSRRHLAFDPGRLSGDDLLEALMVAQPDQDPR